MAASLALLSWADTCDASGSEKPYSEGNEESVCSTHDSAPSINIITDFDGDE
jgi:hypothetical protein